MTKRTPPLPWAKPPTRSTLQQKPKRSTLPRASLLLQSLTQSTPRMHLMARALTPPRRAARARDALVPRSPSSAHVGGKRHCAFNFLQRGLPGGGQNLIYSISALSGPRYNPPNSALLLTHLPTTLN